MLFTTPIFILYFAIVVTLYYLFPHKAQRWFLLLSNYVFYMWSKPAFGILIFLGTLISYFCALAAQKRVLGKFKFWLSIGVIYTIGVLFAFKYVDFFCKIIYEFFGLIYSEHITLVLPVGISFFTFAVAGYLFDVGKGKIEAENNFLNYAIFVSFFPTILAGPIGYARDFLPQISIPKKFNEERVKRGILRFASGAAKKMIIADTLGVVVGTVYGNIESFSNIQILIATFAYSFQIYFDFSAYSDMAISCTEILGYSVMENFNTPYLATSVKEFWKRWHISLTSWFREYLYFPLGGSRKGRIRTYLNVLIVFAVSGLWHGAAITFIIWGLLNGIYQVLGELTISSRVKIRKLLGINENSHFLKLCKIALSFMLVNITWVFFRAESVTKAIYIVKRLFENITCGRGICDFIQMGITSRHAVAFSICIIPFIISDLMKYYGKSFPKLEKYDFLYWFVIIIIVISIFLFGVYGQGFNPQDFVYFKF